MTTKQQKIGIVLFFVLYAVAGLLIFDDYGCGPDEGMERQTSLVNYRYALEKLRITISEENTTWLAYLPDLKEYRDRYYGTALHFPLVLMEAATHFTLESSQFYGMRHFYTFLNFYLAVICFYVLLKRRFGRGLAFCGVLLFVLTPRFFAESFYNNKDVLFTAWYIFSIAACIRWARTKRFRDAVSAGIVLALTCNTRFNAIVFLPLVTAVWGFDFLFNGRRSLRGFCSLLLLLAVTLTVFYAVTPNFWESPLQTLRETFAFNSRHPNHGSEGNLFFGRSVDAAKLWYFVPVWIGLTTPPLILFLGLLGGIVLLCRLVKGRFILALRDGDTMADWLIFCVGFLPTLLIILTHVTIYNTWRHCYFCYPSVIWLTVMGLRTVMKRGRWIPAVLICAFCCVNGVWIARNHPYQFAYFSPLARDHASSFSGDYWGISSRQLLEYIVTEDPNRPLTVNHLYTPAGSINRGLLPIEQRWLLTMTYDEGVADYYITCRDERSTVNIAPKGYEKVHSVRVDRDEIGAVFKRIEGSGV